MKEPNSFLERIEQDVYLIERPNGEMYPFKLNDFQKLILAKETSIKPERILGHKWILHGTEQRGFVEAGR